MASSKDMLRKLEIWKNSKTVLRLTLAPTREFPKQTVGSIVFVDWENELALFAGTEMHVRFPLNVGGAKKFRMGARSCEASRDEDDFFALEEIDKTVLRP